MEFSGQYLTYTEYQALGGTLPEMPFNILEFEARNCIDRYTLGRLKDLDSQKQEVKLCTYKLIGSLDSANENSGKSSESIDGYSVSYFNANEIANQGKGIVAEYLSDCKLDDGTPYMYVGADVNK